VGLDELIIEDNQDFESFLEESHEYWDYVDEALREEKRGLSRVKFYVSDDAEGQKRLKAAKKKLDASGYKLNIIPVKDEDWETNWQQYYHPIEIGERLLVVPEWEEVPEHEGRSILRLNPGLIFGTGNHATTRMCLKEVEKIASKDVNVLDLGCGSGILAIGALVLGAKSALGCDIDDKAPETALKNAALSGVTADKFCVIAGDALSSKSLRALISEKKYELICANIVADVIIKLAPDVPAWLTPDGYFVCSGIIEGRQDEVKAAIKNSGLRIIETRHEEDWYAFTSCLL
jgi:ribosomal protein L11 methyltransferase